MPQTAVCFQETWLVWGRFFNGVTSKHKGNQAFPWSWAWFHPNHAKSFCNNWQSGQRRGKLRAGMAPVGSNIATERGKPILKFAVVWQQGALCPFLHPRPDPGRLVPPGWDVLAAFCSLQETWGPTTALLWVERQELPPNLGRMIHGANQCLGRVALLPWCPGSAPPVPVSFCSGSSGRLGALSRQPSLGRCNASLSLLREMQKGLICAGFFYSCTHK